jgi:hypothetical protein
MASKWYKTIDLTSYAPNTLNNNDIGKRFILVNGNIRQIGTFNRFSPDPNRAYFTFDGKSSPISVDINPLTGYKVYSIDQISLSGTSALTNMPSDIQNNIAGYYGGAKRKSRKTVKRKSRKTVKRKSRKTVKRKSRKTVKRKSKKSRKSRK